MHINLILGNYIDSLIWFKKLKDENEEVVMILDYDLNEDIYCKNDIIYISSECAKKLAKEASSVSYFKSLYVYPGMYRELS
ncbi:MULTISPECIES: hypothetical protein [unclassified Planococcus (in: firmicutes)]|uniref:hypothetical protein n=1 Tax=Planococcus TaxID=1372 RepID=UPI000C7BB23D|nr:MULTISPECIES: hypothetical protein [unclassified Planococcus (in: firmicutes)]PKG45231.1 hypothetical protein CXF66_15610 [Planococcus sp. Urea-trap-24]PKG87573.1 hypothetical protein CXF91_16460 [Planococcus sp. Urea-3u-39]PKH41564.1 hypothetical protein CXF77_05980 [Planococcus sp. MB-3u-09]